MPLGSGGGSTGGPIGNTNPSGGSIGGYGGSWQPSGVSAVGGVTPGASLTAGTAPSSGGLSFTTIAIIAAIGLVVLVVVRMA
jgi:hypothetical protein